MFFLILNYPIKSFLSVFISIFKSWFWSFVKKIGFSIKMPLNQDMNDSSVFLKYPLRHKPVFDKSGK
jgi:hypothetical protein